VSAAKRIPFGLLSRAQRGRRRCPEGGGL